jgi:hypothetical protein
VLLQRLTFLVRPFNDRVSQKNTQNGLLYLPFPSNTIHITSYVTPPYGTKNLLPQNGPLPATQSGKIHRFQMSRSTTLQSQINSTSKLRPLVNFPRTRLYTRESSICRRNWRLWLETCRNEMTGKTILLEVDKMDSLVGMMGGYRVPCESMTIHMDMI